MIRVLLLTGENNHDWRATTPKLRQILEQTGEFEIKVTEEPAILKTSAMGTYDVLLSNYNRGPRWPEKQEQGLLNFVREGGGLVIVHAANNAFPDWPEYDRLIGGTWRAGSYHPAYGPYEVKNDDRNHVITEGIEDFETRDEMYCGLHMQPNIRLLAHSVYDRKPQPMAWIVNYGNGRVFQLALGHDVTAMENLNFIRLLVNGTKWAAGTIS